MRLADRVAVITGGGNGIGRATAIRFAEEGAAAVDNFGGLDVLVTAAGILHASYRSGDIENEAKWFGEHSETGESPAYRVLNLGLDEFRTVMAVYVEGTLLGVQACLARMLDLGRPGSIITIASIASKNPDAGPLSYVCSKSAVWMMTKKLARELAPADIRVNAIGPGFIDTSMTSVINMMPDDVSESFYAGIPMGRKGEPLDIANAALFMASDESSYFTGEILHPDGGYFTE